MEHYRLYYSTTTNTLRRGLAPQGNPPSVRNAATENVTFDFTIPGLADLSKASHRLATERQREREREGVEERRERR